MTVPREAAVAASPRLSILAPAHNEADNVEALVREVHAALAFLNDDGGSGFEFILVDDGSTDVTQRIAIDLARDRPWFRVLAMRDTPPGRGNGQSAAFHAGIRAARGELIGLLDADLQNDPGDFPAMLELLDERNADMVHGDRSHDRRDTIVRRCSSIVGRLFRRWLLGDTIRDTGCSLRIMRRDVALQIPLQFKGMHRFIPITARQLGFKVLETPVHHRPRVAGEAKYGIWNRAIPGLIDCLAVRWMDKRRRPVHADDLTVAPDAATTTPTSEHSEVPV
jgi:dolichol-phosphate mannosyltransferase